jgi:hypothetical protein
MPFQQRPRIEPMKKSARSLRQHRELTLNYFRVKRLLSRSVVVEGLYHTLVFLTDLKQSYFVAAGAPGSV